MFLKTSYILLIFWKFELIVSEKLCSCTNDISIPIYTEPTKASELLAELSFQDCVSVLHNYSNEWSRVLYREKVGYMLTSDSERYLCQGDKHIQINRRFLDFFYRCLADHCMRCHCEKHEASCGDCGSTCSLDYSSLCQKWKTRVDGQWSSWLTWSNCSTSVCGNVGVRTRMRDCNNPPKSAQFGKDCVGDKLQTINCTTPCKVDGQWSEWSSYGLCSVTCGDGTKTRTRTCTNPSPRNGGNNCTGGAEQTEICSTGTECVVDGGYSEWTTWTDCQGECGSSGLIYRQRSCNNPKPSGGGKQCIGKKFDYIPCVKTCTSSTTTMTTPQQTTTPTTTLAHPTTPSTTLAPTTTTTPPITLAPTKTTLTTLAQPTTHSTTLVHLTKPSAINNNTTASETPTTIMPTSAGLITIIDTTSLNTDIITNPAPTKASTSPTTETKITNTVTLPVPALHHCDKLKLTDDIVKGTKLTSPKAALCPDSQLHTSPEAVVIENCNVSSPDTWTKGMSVVELCKIGVPKSYFPPISSFIGNDYDRIHDLSGVLLECTNKGIKMALQICGHPVGIFPITNNTFVSTLDLNNYFVIN